ncbi:hypothetical protein JW824_00040 [bacterium]|nr:hypothetical protein [bacterium]RQV99530.1 MAG: hypothetical protein EH221_00050 [bacterium]
MHAIIPVFIVGIVFGSILLFTKHLTDSRVKNKLIEKGLVDENVKYLYGNRYDSAVPSALKWGIVLTGIGLAFLVGHLFPEELKEEITIAAMFLLAGLGLIIYYLISKHLSNQAKD